jgi:hypothetical protein
MEELEYITKDALMMCDQGGAPDFFKPTFNNKVKIHGCLVATNKDAVPLSNIPSFKVCKITRTPCMPATVPLTWQDTWQVKVKGINSLIGKSTCKCSVGGKIEFMTSGQIPLPDDAMAEVKEMQEQAQRELDDSGNGNSVGEAGFAEGLIPVWGSGRDLINDIQTGDGLGAVMNAGFLIWDVASIAAGAVSFGAATVAMQGAKTGLKATLKAGGKVIAKSAVEALGKVGFKKLSKEVLKNSIDDVAKKLLKTCVFACFPAGTLIQTEFGTKPIEDIQIGDRVWAYDEDTGTTALQPVVDVMENESDHTISLYTETEVIETTALHPFYTEEGWKDASELQKGDKILTKKQEKIEIKKVEFNYEPKKVYNFTVANFHTYFVGVLAWLVHNAGRCLSEFAKKGEKWAIDILRGIAFNKKMNKEMLELANKKGLKYFSETWIKKGGKLYSRVDGYIPDKAIIERKATDLSKISPETAKSYINQLAKKYDEGLEIANKTKGDVLKGEKFLQVDKIGNVSDEVLQHAEDMGVTIVENIDDIFTLIGH